jgi:hypothetical protein
MAERRRKGRLSVPASAARAAASAASIFSPCGKLLNRGSLSWNLESLSRLERTFSTFSRVISG